MASIRLFASAIALAACAGASDPASAQAPPDASAANAGSDLSETMRRAISGDAALLALAPSDIANFCPNFAMLDADDRVQFWTNFMARLADAESGGDPNHTHWSAFDLAMHRPTFRRGLFQISIEAAHSRHYQCDVATGKDLTAPNVNAACAVKILEENISATGAIADARYWPTLAHADWRAQLAASVAATAPCSSQIEEQQ